MTNWARYGTEQYEYWRKSHEATHDVVRQFIRLAGVDRVLEIGGGDGAMASSMQPGKYVNIDANPQAMAICRRNGGIAGCGDWRTFDWKTLVWWADMVLACNVLEHTGHVGQFIAKSLDQNPRWIVMSFFNGLGESNPNKRIVHHGISLFAYTFSAIQNRARQISRCCIIHRLLVKARDSQPRDEEIVILSRTFHTFDVLPSLNGIEIL